jgi:hypothetical protein
MMFEKGKRGKGFLVNLFQFSKERLGKFKRRLAGDDKSK